MSYLESPTRADCAADIRFKDMNRLVSATRLKPVVDTVFPFADTKKAFECLAGQNFVGKIVIKVVE